MQDYIFAIGSICFIIALIPTIRSQDKPPLFTSWLTATILTIFSITYLSLDLKYAATTTAITALCWWIIFWQKDSGKHKLS